EQRADRRRAGDEEQHDGERFREPGPPPSPGLDAERGKDVPRLGGARELKEERLREDRRGEELERPRCATPPARHPGPGVRGRVDLPVVVSVHGLAALRYSWWHREQESARRA